MTAWLGCAVIVTAGCVPWTWKDELKTEKKKTKKRQAGIEECEL
jgi:hypothetical protein